MAGVDVTLDMFPVDLREYKSRPCTSHYIKRKFSKEGVYRCPLKGIEKREVPVGSHPKFHLNLTNNMRDDLFSIETFHTNPLFGKEGLGEIFIPIKSGSIMDSLLNPFLVIRKIFHSTEDFLKSLGVIPVYFLKILKKWDSLLNPNWCDTCDNFTSLFLSRSCLDFSILNLLIYSLML